MPMRWPFRGRSVQSAREAAPAAPPVPCIPCAQKTGVRQLSLNEPSAPLLVEGEAVPRHAATVQVTVAEDTVVLDRVETGDRHVLNPSAALIWASIDDVATVSAIIDDLHARTGVHRAVIASDVQQALAGFVAAGVVTFDG